MKECFPELHAEYLNIPANYSTRFVTEECAPGHNYDKAIYSIS